MFVVCVCVCVCVWQKTQHGVDDDDESENNNGVLRGERLFLALQHFTTIKRALFGRFDDDDVRD